MMDVFISYSKEDTVICEQLYSDLTKYFDVWIDRSELKGGMEWEQSIMDAISQSTFFLVVISNHSIKSSWVNKEIQQAEDCEISIIPLLLIEELPGSLKRLQYIDLKRNYEIALEKIIEVITERIDPSDSKSNEIHRLIGSAIISFLWRDYQKANGLIGMALNLNRSLGKNSADFWNSLVESFSISEKAQDEMAASLAPFISLDKKSEYDSHDENGVQLYSWQVWVETNDEILSMIDSVTYYLHPSFPTPIQKVKYREDHFKISRLGWGSFNIDVEVEFVDHSKLKIKYPLDLWNK